MVVVLMAQSFAYLSKLCQIPCDDLPGSNAPQPVCKFCEKPFRRRRKDQIYCMTTCRQQAYQDRQKALKKAGS